MSDLYTCITCRVAFKDGDTQRVHYKSDWHRYNLKRKVAELVPVSADEFKNRVIAQRSEEQQATEAKGKYCDACRKNFNNENSYTNHLNSKKHRDNELHKLDSELEVRLAEKVVSNKSSNVVPSTNEDSDSSCEEEEVDSDEWEEDFENPVANNVCLFCTHRSRSLVRNLRHMSLAHSFFIPDAEFCVNVSGLVNYLGEKVYEGFMCLWCNDVGRSFHSAEAAQGHMRDKGHCKMLHEGAVLAEYAEFYDYSTSYPDGEQMDVDVDEEIDVSVLDGGDYQLVLPSGAVIGHRSLARYYKQSLNPNSAVVAIPKSTRVLNRVIAQYRAIGWTESKKEQVAKKARDLKYMQRVQTKWRTKLELKTNKFQKHFRQQVLF